MSTISISQIEKKYKLTKYALSKMKARYDFPKACGKKVRLLFYFSDEVDFFFENFKKIKQKRNRNYDFLANLYVPHSTSKTQLIKDTKEFYRAISCVKLHYKTRTSKIYDNR